MNTRTISIYQPMKKGYQFFIWAFSLVFSLSAGTTLWANDGGDPQSLSVKINVGAALCQGVNDGVAAAQASGGLPPYSYAWNNGGTTQIITNLGPAWYSVTVTDQAGNTASAVAILGEREPVTLVTGAKYETCEASNDGEAVVYSTQGYQPYHYQWSDGGKDTFFREGLDAGIYTVTVTDGRGCSAVTSIKVELSPEGIWTMMIKDADAKCYGDKNGAAHVKAMYSDVDMCTTCQFKWSNGETGMFATMLPAGLNYVTVTDALGCVRVDSVFINQPAQVVLQLTGLTRSLCNQSTGTFSVQAQGGTPPFNYLWNTGATSNSLSNLPEGIYSVTATDAAGCTGVYQDTVKDDCNPLNCDAGAGALTIPGVTCIQLPQTSLKATQSVAPTIPVGYQTLYLLTKNGIIIATSATPDFNVLTSGQYAIHTLVYDPNTFNPATGIVLNTTTAQSILKLFVQGGGDICGALDATGATTKVSDPINLIAPRDTFLCDPEIWLAAGASTGVTFQWKDQNGNVLSTANPFPFQSSFGKNVLTIVATDASGCSETAQVIVDNKGVNASITGPDLLCLGDEATLNIVNNTPGDQLSIVWDPSNLSGNPVKLSVTGNVTVKATITNQFNCSTTLTKSINSVDVSGGFSVQAAQCEEDFQVTFQLSDVYATYYDLYFNDPAQPGQTSTGAKTVKFKYSGVGPFQPYLKAKLSLSCLEDSIDIGKLTLIEDPATALKFNVLDKICGDSLVLELIADIVNQPLGIKAYQWFVDGKLVGTGDKVRLVYPATVNTNDLKIELLGVNTLNCELKSLPQNFDFPQDDLSDKSVSACAGTSLDLSGLSEDPRYTYRWEPANLVTDPDKANTTLKVTPQNALALTLRRTYASDPGCFTEIKYEVKPYERATYAIPVRNNIICDGDSTIIAIVPPTNIRPGSLVWSSTNQQSDTLSMTDELKVPALDIDKTFLYYVFFEDENGCEYMDSMNVTNKKFEFDITRDSALVCHNTELNLDITQSGSILPSLSVTATSDNGAMVMIDKGDGKVKVMAEKTTRLFISVSNGACVEYDTLALQVINLDGTLNATAKPQLICEGDKVQLEATPGFTNYLWDNAGTLNDPNLQNPTGTPTTNTIYTVTVTDPNGCQTMDTVAVQVMTPECREPYIFFPTAFSPNGDKVNDELRVRVVGTAEVYWAVWNRWGELIYEANSIDDVWDGSYKGKDQASDVFAYVLKVKCPGGETFTKKGNVSLIK